MSRTSFSAVEAPNMQSSVPLSKMTLNVSEGKISSCRTSWQTYRIPINARCLIRKCRMSWRHVSMFVMFLKPFSYIPMLKVEEPQPTTRISSFRSSDKYG